MSKARFVSSLRRIPSCLLPLASCLLSLILALLLMFLAVSSAVAAPEAAAPPDAALSWPLLAGSLAFLVPLGFALIAAGGLPAEEARQVTLAALAALALATLGYWACGFALQFGGVGLIYRSGGLEELVWEWSALDIRWGTGWGMAGLHGFGLTGGAATPGALALFLSQLPWLTTATLIPLLSLRGRAPTLVAALGGLLVGALIYPLVGNWVWGGGWLANLGYNLGLGHGFVDFAGSGLVHLLGAAVACAGILTFVQRSRGAEEQRSRGESPQHPSTSAPPPLGASMPSSLGASVPSSPGASVPQSLPPVHLPLLATLGAILLLVGSLAWAWANPLLDWNALDPARLAVNLLLAATSGAFLPLAYTWFVANRPDPLMAVRGLAAGLVAISASGPFVPPWAAPVIGGVAGLLTPLACYLVDHLLRWKDPTAALTVHGLSGLWGLLATALFADGTLGAGWNRIGAEEYLHVAGQGVSGLWTAVGFQPDWPGQLQAQAVGLAAIGLFAFLVASLAFGLLGLVSRLVGWSRYSSDGPQSAVHSPD
ncbi:MAG: hypothetical protein QHJ81_15505 [Anaerolineae bacterium]|nr:hypothetical protein [Anaerolineae bacterium]